MKKTSSSKASRDDSDRNRRKPANVGADGGSSSEPSFPLLIVGIGASAGGLEAFKTFFSHVPTDNVDALHGFAYVLVQHLSPEHVSLLAQLVGRSTTMPVIEASDGSAWQLDTSM